MNPDRYAKLRAKLHPRNEGWRLPAELFGDAGCDIYDFEANNYRYLLDNASTLKELLRGLDQLSPLADDALEVAVNFTEHDFALFRDALQRERTAALSSQGSPSTFPDRWLGLLLPDLFVRSLRNAPAAELPLGAMAIRLIELEAEA